MDPREDYNRMQDEKISRGDTDFRFPIAGELMSNWEKKDIALGDLMNRDDLQLYIGDPGSYMYSVYKQTDTSKAREIGIHWDTIKKYIPNDKQVESINTDLANLVAYSREIDHEYPLIIVENSRMLPFNGGSMIDGTHRLIALLNSLRNGELQESTPIPVWTGKLPILLAIPYNVSSMILADKKPLYEKVKIFKERIIKGNTNP